MFVCAVAGGVPERSEVSISVDGEGKRMAGGLGEELVDGVWGMGIGKAKGPRRESKDIRLKHMKRWFV